MRDGLVEELAECQMRDLFWKVEDWAIEMKSKSEMREICGEFDDLLAETEPKL